MDVTSLHLHDALLNAVYISWEAERCDIRVLPVERSPAMLVFEGFTSLAFPNEKPWGASSSINSVRESKPGEYEIELQSGDVLIVRAKSFGYREEA